MTSMTILLRFVKSYVKKSTQQVHQKGYYSDRKFTNSSVP